MARGLLARMQEVLPPARRILEIGCGTGYLTALLRRAYPGAELVALDLDAALVEQARSRLGPDSRVSWLVMDGEAFDRGNFDLIVSNAAFQWFTTPGETIKAYARLLSPQGYLVFSSLGPQTFRELEVSLGQAAAALHLEWTPEISARGFLTLRDWENLLAQAGLSRVRLEQRLLEAHFPSVSVFLEALKATGATNPRPRPFSPRLLHALVRAYDSRFRVNGSIPVTYEIFWALARK